LLDQKEEQDHIPTKENTTEFATKQNGTVASKRTNKKNSSLIFSCPSNSLKLNKIS
jgi:hypothetical protein